MLQIQQSAGSPWLAATVNGRLVVVDTRSQQTQDVDQIFDAVARGSDVQPVLSMLTGAGLAATPPFALLEWHEAPRQSTGTAQSPGTAQSTGAAPSMGTVRCIVRGSVRLSVHTADGTIELDAADVSTWREQLIEHVAGFQIELDDAPTTDAVPLPLETGAAWVRSVSSRHSGHHDVIDPGPEPASAEPDGEQQTNVDSASPAEVSIDHVDADQVDAEQASQDTVIDLPATVADPQQSSAADDEQLFGATVIRPVDAVSTAPAAGDHDGQTVLSADIKKMRDEAGAEPAAAEQELGSAAVPAPSRFMLQVTDGESQQLDDVVLVGRAPSVSKVPGARVPTLLTVGGGDQDISRNHVQFTVEGDTVVVTDLHSRNGTMIILPGRAPQKLRAGEPTSIIAGTRVDLGGGVTMTVSQR